MRYQWLVFFLCVQMLIKEKWKPPIKFFFLPFSIESIQNCEKNRLLNGDPQSYIPFDSARRVRKMSVFVCVCKPFDAQSNRACLSEMAEWIWTVCTNDGFQLRNAPQNVRMSSQYLQNRQVVTTKCFVDYNKVFIQDCALRNETTKVFVECTNDFILFTKVNFQCKNDTHFCIAGAWV